MADTFLYLGKADDVHGILHTVLEGQDEPALVVACSAVFKAMVQFRHWQKHKYVVFYNVRPSDVWPVVIYSETRPANDPLTWTGIFKRLLAGPRASTAAAYVVRENRVDCYHVPVDEHIVTFRDMALGAIVMQEAHSVRL